MLYLANPCSQAVRESMQAGILGLIDTPAQRNLPIPGVTWAADNGCFSKRGYPGDEGYLRWLASRAAYAEHCLFATAPDVVGDAAATLARSAPMLPLIRAAGYRPALVAQDGLEDLDIPWETFGAVFLGGSTAWKLGPGARKVAAEAVRRGLHVHMGRVNSLRRLRYAMTIGCSSADGTFLTFGPDTNLPRVMRWLAAIDAQPPLSLAG